MWSNEEPDEGEIHVEATLLFDQRKIHEDLIFRTDRRGRLMFDIKRWNHDFCLDDVRSAELPEMDVLRTPPMDTTISSTDTEDVSPKSVIIHPKKRQKLEHRFVISSSDED